MENNISSNDNDQDPANNLYKKQEQWQCDKEIGFQEESSVGRHNGDEEIQLENVAEQSEDRGALKEKVSVEAGDGIEILDIEPEPDLEEPYRKIKSISNKYNGESVHSLWTRGQESKVETDKTAINKCAAVSNSNVEAADSSFEDGMQFSHIVENIYFLDEEALIEEHENDKQKLELLTELGNEKILGETKNQTSLPVDHLSNKKTWVNSNAVGCSGSETLENMGTEVDDTCIMISGSPFSYIPDELIVKIFSYLNTEQLCKHASPVCKKWRQISKEPTLWRCIDFHCYPEMESLNLLWVLRKTPLLQKLVLRGRTNITHAEVAILSEMCPMLSDVDFGFCDNLSSEMIQTLAENCKCLTKINVEGCGKIDHNCIKCLSKSKKLAYLNFSHCFLQDESLTYLADCLPHIVSINLDGISWITDRGVSSLVSKHSSHLVELVLDGADITDAAIRNIARCHELQTLELSFCECLTDDALSFLKDLKNLKELKLRKGSSFTKEGTSEFFRSEKLAHLKALNLSECTCIDDSVVLDIAKSCGSHLTFLSLCWCWFITDTGLVPIVDHCRELETLELLGIDKITGVCLARVPEEIPHLTFLDLRQCNKIVDSLIVEMIRKKPDLKVLNYYGEEFVHS